MGIGRDIGVDVVFGSRQAGFLKGLKGIQSKLKATSARFRSVGSKLTLGLTAPIIGLGIASIKASVDFNKGMASVATLIPGNIDRVNSLKDSVSDLSIVVGKSVEDLSGGLFQVISAFGDTADTMDVLTISAKASVAGLSSTEEAVDLLSTITEGYGDQSAAAVQKVADLAFTTNRLGKTTFPELAASMGNVVAISTELGVSQEELFGVFATGTSLVKATKVATQYQGALQALLKPMPAMNELLKAQGVASGRALIKMLGLEKSFQLIAETARRTNTPITDFIGSIEGATLVLGLTGAQADKFAEKLKAMQDVTGAATEAYLEQTDGINKLGHEMNVMTASVKAIGREIGEILAPVIQKANKGVTKATMIWQRLDKSTKLMIVSIAGFAAVLGPLIVGLSFAILLISPWAILGVAIVSVGAAGLLIARNWKTIGPQLIRIWQSLFQDLRGKLSNFNNDVIEVGRLILQNLRELIGENLWNTLLASWEIGLAALVGLLIIRSGFLVGIWGALGFLLRGGLVVGAFLAVKTAWDKDLLGIKTSLQGFELNVDSTVENIKSAFEGLGPALSKTGLFSFTGDTGDQKQDTKSSSLGGAGSAENLRLLQKVLLEQTANLREFAGTAGEVIAAMSRAISTEFIGMATSAIEATDRLTNSVLNLWQALDRELISGSLVPNMVNNIVGELDRLNSEGVPVIKTAVSTMAIEFMNAEPAIGSFYEEVERLKQIIMDTDEFKAMADLIGELKDVMKEGKEQAKGFAKAVANIPAVVNAALAETPPALDKTLSFMDVLFQNFKFNAITVFEDIRAAAIFTWGSIQSQFVASLAGMIQGTATFKEFMTQFWNTILQSAINTILSIGVQWALAQLVQREEATKNLIAHEAIEATRLATTGATELARIGIMEATNKAMLGAAATTITTMVAIGETAIGIMAIVITATAAVFAAIGAGLTAGVYTAPFAAAFFEAATVIEGAGLKATGIAALAIGAAGTGALGVISGLAGPVPLAHGGIVTAPTLAVLGEGRKKEAVIPLDNLEGMFGRREQTIVIEFDGRRLAERVVPHLPRTVRMKLGAAM